MGIIGKGSNKMEAVVIAGAVPMVASMGLKTTGMVADSVANPIFIVGLIFEVLALMGLAYCRYRTPETVEAAVVSAEISQTPGPGDSVDKAELLSRVEAISGDVDRLKENVKELKQWVETRS